MKNKPAEGRKRRAALLMTGGMTVIAVLIFVGANLLATSLESRYALNADLSFNSLTMQSAVTEVALSQLSRPVSLYLLTAGSGDYFGDSAIRRRDLETILERYRSLNGRISCESVSLLANPTWATRYSDWLQGEKVAEDAVLIVCEGGDDANVRLSIVDAVSKITGLGADRISVLKMR